MPPHPAPSRPPRWWDVLTWILLTVAVGYVIVLVANVAYIWQDYGLLERLITGQQTADSAEFLGHVSTGVTVNAVTRASLFLELFAFLVWLAGASFLLRRRGLAPKEALRHWSLISWRVGLVLTVVYGMVVNRMSLESLGADLDESVRRFDQLQLIFTVVRMVVTGLLLFGIVTVARRVRTILSAAPTTALPTTARMATAQTTAPTTPPANGWRPADDAFWVAVADLAARNPSTPLLALSASGNRWQLISSDVDITSARSAFPEGAQVIAYSTPPQPVDAKVLGQIAGRVRSLTLAGRTSATVGLIDDGNSARFDELFTESQLTDWLERARSAVRVGAYPTDPGADPGSLWGVVPHARSVL